MSAQSSPIRISVVVPARNEAQNLPVLVEKIVRGAQAVPATFEIILIDDGSTDQTPSVLSDLASRYPELHVLRNPESRGISGSVTRGIKQASGDILVFLPADLQSDPEEDIPKLVAPISSSVDVVAGFRKGRADGRERSSAVYNWLLRVLFSIDGHDLNWIKASKREFVSGIELRGGWYRLLIPILVARGAKVVQVETNWYPRVHGKSKFSAFRFIPFIWDVVAVRFLTFRWSRNFGSALAFGALVLAPMMVAFWTFDRYAGTASGSSHGSHHGSAQRSITSDGTTHREGTPVAEVIAR